MLTERTQKEKEEIEDLTTELELADEDEKIQYVSAAQRGKMRNSVRDDQWCEWKELPDAHWRRSGFPA